MHFVAFHSFIHSFIPIIFFLYTWGVICRVTLAGVTSCTNLKYIYRRALRHCTLGPPVDTAHLWLYLYTVNKAGQYNIAITQPPWWASCVSSEHSTCCSTTVVGKAGPLLGLVSSQVCSQHGEQTEPPMDTACLWLYFHSTTYLDPGGHNIHIARPPWRAGCAPCGHSPTALIPL